MAFPVVTVICGMNIVFKNKNKYLTKELEANKRGASVLHYPKTIHDSRYGATSKDQLYTHTLHTFHHHHLLFPLLNSST
jgi:hypothetical protein